MAKFLAKAKYTNDGLKGLIKEGGTARRAVVEKLMESMGGRVEAFYYAFGDADLYLIVDGPDNISAAAISMTVNAAGGAEVTMVPLLTPEDIDAAAKKTPLYRPPGH